MVSGEALSEEPADASTVRSSLNTPATERVRPEAIVSSER